MIKVNDTCIGCGACVSIDPEHFDFNEGLSVPTNQEITDSVREAAGACPVGAIEITEETGFVGKVVETSKEETTETEDNNDLPMAA